MASEVIYHSIKNLRLHNVSKIGKKNVLERFELKPNKDQKVAFVRCRIIYVLNKQKSNESLGNKLFRFEPIVSKQRSKQGAIIYSICHIQPFKGLYRQKKYRIEQD